METTAGSIIKEIINAIIRFLKEFAKVPKFSQVLFTIMLVSVSFTAGQCRSEKSLQEFRKQFVAVQADAKSAKAYAEKTKVQVNKLLDEVNEKDQTINKLNVAINVSNQKRATLKTNLVALEKSLDIAKDTAEIVQVQQGIIYNLTEQLTEAENIMVKQQEVNTTQRTQILGLQTAVALSMKRGDSLQTVVDRVIVIKPPTTSKTNKILIGALGFVAGVWVGNQ